MGFTQLFTGVLTILGTLIFMFSIHPLIALVVVVLTPLSLFVASFIAKRTYIMFRRQSETRGQLTALTDEMLGNMKVVQALATRSGLISGSKRLTAAWQDTACGRPFSHPSPTRLPALSTAWFTQR